ncbi:MAG: serine hydroxymethyltransferase [Candidatus Latescibacteria bacterium]|nr:serine hydroxymethyltransferase [Candidatus Latescibacterota bacterium]
MAERDPLLRDILYRESERQASQIELIASENIVSAAVLEALGSAITNKTVEGYPGARFHRGAGLVDEAERAAIDRARQLFGCNYANVQPHAGSQANQAVFAACLEPGDTVLSMSLSAGGHLSHGAPANLSGQWFNAVQYGVVEGTGLLDYEELGRLASEHRPRLIIAGGSSYPRTIDFEAIRSTANRVEALFLVDMAHFAGLVAGWAHPSPMPHAHIVSCTTTKTLRGPRGGLLLTNDAGLARKIDSAVFPGVQGSLHPNVIAAKAVCLGEALQPEFRTYARAVVDNARSLAAALEKRGLGVCAGGTDTHLVLVDVSMKGLTGVQAERCLEAAGITCNRNAIPTDPANSTEWSGLRFGSAACTTRGMGTEEFRRIGEMIGDLLNSASETGESSPEVVCNVSAQVREICAEYPTYL